MQGRKAPWMAQVLLCLPHIFIISALSALILTCSVARADFPAAIELAAISEKSGVRLSRERPGDSVGNAVADIGDINGDGRTDFAVVTSRIVSNRPKDRNRVFVVLGPRSGIPGGETLKSLDGRNGFEIVFPAGSDSRDIAIAAAGDVNGDGFGDIVLGARHHTIASVYASGAAYVLYGKRRFSRSLHISLLDRKSGTRIVTGSPQAFLGHAVTGGDIDGDGFSDVVVGVPGLTLPNSDQRNGAIFVIYGGRKGLGKLVDLDNPPSNVARMNGQHTNSSLGVSAAILDFNGDGLPDIAVGEPAAVVSTLSAPRAVGRVGAIHVKFGVAGRLPRQLFVGDLNGADGFSIRGEQVDANLGRALAAAGDVNGDGYGDLIMGAPGYDDGMVVDTGTAYVLYGSPNWPARSDLEVVVANGGARRFSTLEIGAATGTSVAGAGDVNGDGYDDVIIGSPFGDRDDGAVDAGSTYVVFGNAFAYSPVTSLPSLTGDDGFKLRGAARGSANGKAVAPAGDINRDGFDEFLTGAPSANTGGRRGSGAAYLLKGRAPTRSVVRTGWHGPQTIRGGRGADTLSGGEGFDVLEGKGGADVLDGGNGRDAASYEYAPAGVTADLRNPARGTGQAAGDTFVSVESLVGSRFSDRLSGDDEINRIEGMGGRDTLSGGGQPDLFTYRSIRDSRPGVMHRDVIVDFDPGTVSSSVDYIDLSRIDANIKRNGKQRFRYIGTKPFSRQSGELRAGKLDGRVLIQADVTGDGRADMEILIRNLRSAKNLNAADFEDGLSN